MAELLRELIRLNTVNPPGNETAAAELLRDYLAESGVESELYAKVPERANLVARIPGRGDGPSLLFLSHTDTVVADPSKWQVDPWSGELRDGEIWGRGALDMKGGVAMMVSALLRAAADELVPAGDLILVLTSGEETGSDVGAPAKKRTGPLALWRVQGGARVRGAVESEARDHENISFNGVIDLNCADLGGGLIPF